jgi:hypothetical protein
MELDFALLAEAADTNDVGKVSMLGGGIDGVSLEKVPATIPPIAIVARFSIGPDEWDGQHSISIELQRPQGDRKWIVENAPVDFGKPLSQDRRTYATALVKAAFKFESFGKHEILVYADGGLMKSLALYVNEKSHAE